MTTEFIPYEEALALKELGFDEMSFGEHWIQDDMKPFMFEKGQDLLDLQFQKEETNNVDDMEFVCKAPLYQQAFRWFREKHSLNGEITWDERYEYSKGKWSDAIYSITITDVSYKKEWKGTSPDNQRRNGKQKTYEDTELACLRKLIEIVKNK